MRTGDYWERIAAFINWFLREAKAPDAVAVQADPYEVREMLALLVREVGIPRAALRRELLQRCDLILHEEDLPPEPDNRPESGKSKSRSRHGLPENI